MAKVKTTPAWQLCHRVVVHSHVAAAVEREASMTARSHIASLQEKHDKLEEDLRALLAQPSSGDQTIADLKRRKLRIKDELTRLTADPSLAARTAGAGQDLLESRPNSNDPDPAQGRP
jgi:hypothetical protein